MSVKYLDQSRITRAKRNESPSYGMTVYGYTKRSGAPSNYMIQLDGESRWRRVMFWKHSNGSSTGTLFVRVKGELLVIGNGWHLQEMADREAKLNFIASLLTPSGQ